VISIARLGGNLARKAIRHRATGYVARDERLADIVLGLSIARKFWGN